MDVHVALGQELERLHRLVDGNADTAVVEFEAELRRITAIEDALLTVEATTLVGAVLQLRLIAHHLECNMLSDDFQGVLAAAARGALAVVEAVGGIERAAYAGDQYIPLGVVVH